MINEDGTRKIALAGMIIVIVSLAIGAWVSIEYMIMADDDASREDEESAQERTAFFYDHDSNSGFYDLDGGYFYNPIPGYSGFNFYLLMMGITLIIFGFYSKQSLGMEQRNNFAKIGLIIMIISLIIGLWMGYANHQVVTSGDSDEREGLRSMLSLIRPVNSMLVFLGPALILYSLVKLRDPEFEPMIQRSAKLGIALLIVSMVLAVFVGACNMSIADEYGEDDPDDELVGRLFKTKAFISNIFPFLPVISLGLLLFAFTQNYHRRTFVDTAPSLLVNIGFILIIIGFLLVFHPAMKYQQFAIEFADGEWFLGWLEELNDYAQSTGYLNWASSIMFLGIGIMVFSPIYGHSTDTATIDLKSPKMKNMIYFLLLIVGVVLGFIVGNLKQSGDELPREYFLIQYLYTIILYSSLGMVIFNWTGYDELFRDEGPGYQNDDDGFEYDPQIRPVEDRVSVQYLERPIGYRMKICPDCNGEMEFIDAEQWWYCSICGEYK